MLSAHLRPEVLHTWLERILQRFQLWKKRWRLKESELDECTPDWWAPQTGQPQQWAATWPSARPRSSVSNPHFLQLCSRWSAPCSAPPPGLVQRILSPFQSMLSIFWLGYNSFSRVGLTFFTSSKLEMKVSSSTAPAAPPREIICIKGKESKSERHAEV